MLHGRDGLGDGSIGSAVDPDVTAVWIIGLLRGTAMMMLTTARDLSVSEISAEVARGVGRSLAAQ